MFKFLGHKLLNKKWLNACLLLGIVLLVAVASCNPMFKNGAMDMTLSSKFDAAIEDNNVYSAVIGRGGSCDTKEYPDSDAVEARVSAYEKKWLFYIKCTGKLLRSVDVPTTFAILISKLSK